MSNPGPRLARIAAPLLALAALTMLPFGASATAAPEPRPTTITGGTDHVLDNSAELKGVVNPNHIEVDYVFQYGTTTAYGSQTPLVNLGGSDAPLKVAQYIAGLQPATIYHFRIIALPSADTSVAPTWVGRDHVFTTKGVPQTFTVTRQLQDVYGSPLILSGTLTGSHSADAAVALQASPYPFLEPFTPIGVTGLTNAGGAFSFRVANLSRTTQFRVVTVGLEPVFSSVITARVAVRVSFHVRSSGVPGLVRMYGTFTPAIAGAKVFFQVQKAVRPGPSEISEAWVSQFAARAKKAGGNNYRFSTVVKLRRSGRYRAYVSLPGQGALTSGASQRTIILHAPKSTR